MADGKLTRIDAWTKSDSKVLQLLASVLAQQKRLRQAVAILECVREQDPENAEALRALAAMHLELDRHEEALEAADLALTHDPSRTHRAGLMLVRGHALWGLGREEEAIDAMRAFAQERRKT
ncbi:MAG: tetratricopeptide repeat protein [Pseudomonadota bacterium]